jgi:hypothetical protein
VAVVIVHGTEFIISKVKIRLKDQSFFSSGRSTPRTALTFPEPFTLQSDKKTPSLQTCCHRMQGPRLIQNPVPGPRHLVMPSWSWSLKASAILARTGRSSGAAPPSPKKLSPRSPVSSRAISYSGSRMATGLRLPRLACSDHSVWTANSWFAASAGSLIRPDITWNSMIPDLD